MNDEISSTPLDTHFAALMVRLNGRADADLERAARAVSAARSQGHICIELAALGGEAVAEKLRATQVVGAPGEFTPLILDDRGRLYLQRYWQYEHDLAAALHARLQAEPAWDARLLAAGLKRIFAASKERPDFQREAAEKAVCKSFCVITGGPGTGKTRTVAAVLVLLHEQFAAHGAALRVALAAPTGKAAARLKESIQRTVDTDAAFAGLRDRPAPDATTLHRLLGVIPDSPYFRQDAERPLAVDAVIVDEASMLDLALMAKLVAAVPATARLILLGDKDQLASVEAGNVLGDICNTVQATATTAPLAAHIVELRKNYRFRAGSGIQRLSALVNAGQADQAAALLAAGGMADVAASATPAAPALAGAVRPHVLAGFRAALEGTTPDEALRRLGDFRILCATRRGPFGVENLNRLAEQVLAEEGFIAPDGLHYHGRPVLIRANDYHLRLFNGDVGLILRDAEAAGDLRAFFLDAEGALRRLLPARLPEHETTFAMTVHKSQGSEFDRLLLVLPDRDGPLLTRELVYTGLTRARTSVELWAGAAILRAAVLRRTERASGLREALWGERQARAVRGRSRA